MLNIDQVQNLYGLIGYPLSHSFSKKYFGDKFEQEQIQDHHYELFPLDTIEKLPGLIEKYDNLKGLNVTVPYKESVIPFLDELEEDARSIGAVNTIKISDNKLIGYNTDVWGFRQSLLRFLEEKPTTSTPLKALILGTGGAAKAVAFVLHNMGIDFSFVSRREGADQFTYVQLSRSIIDKHLLIINTTPLGMSPKTEAAPAIPFAYIGENHLLYDLVYNPSTTTFMKKGMLQGGKAKNGLEMLHLQAEKSWEIWKNERV